jgi:hypothetical protein
VEKLVRKKGFDGAGFSGLKMTGRFNYFMLVDHFEIADFLASPERSIAKY